MGVCRLDLLDVDELQGGLDARVVLFMAFTAPAVSCAMAWCHGVSARPRLVVYIVCTVL